MSFPECLLQSCWLSGVICRPEVNHGQPVPVFTPKGRTDGKPDINTLEGWNTYAQELENRRSACVAPPRR